MILLATNRRDITSDFVVLALERRGIPFFRLNTETLSRAAVSFHPRSNENCWTIGYPGREILHLADVRAGYLRRPELPTVSQDISDDTKREYSKSEWSSLLVSALRSLGSKWLNSPNSILLAEDKPRQLFLANQLGFDIPDTLITNDPEKAREFASRGHCIAKPLSSSLFGKGDAERVIFTTRLNYSDLINNEEVKAAPMILQREIGKKYDLRITIVGERVFSAEIHSQSKVETEVDWRRGAHLDLEHRRHELPDTVSEKCVQLTQQLGLKFSAIDLVLSEDGRYCFLEINPNGQWAWLEHRLGFNISEAIVDELMRISRC